MGLVDRFAAKIRSKEQLISKMTRQLARRRAVVAKQSEAHEAETVKISKASKALAKRRRCHKKAGIKLQIAQRQCHDVADLQTAKLDLEELEEAQLSPLDAQRGKIDNAMEAAYVAKWPEEDSEVQA